MPENIHSPETSASGGVGSRGVSKPAIALEIELAESGPRFTNLPVPFTNRGVAGQVRRDRPGASRRAGYKIEAILEELKGLATRVGLEVREERLLREVGYQVRSGSCRVREQNLLFVDRELPPASRLEILLEELSRRDLGEVYISPELRRILGKDERAALETS